MSYGMSQETRSPRRPGQFVDGQRPLGGLSAAVDAIDRRLMPRWCRRRGAAVDRLMIAASRAADYWLLWLLTAAVLNLAGGDRGRRAARRGLVALVLGSSTANGPVKLAVNRPRPAFLRSDDLRALRSSSFPSGHTAAAVAFATAVSREWPAVGPVIIPLAALVSYSRVYLGAHFPSDVLAGGAIGVGSGLVAADAGRLVSGITKARPS